MTDKSQKVVKAGAGYVVGNYLLKGITFLSAPIFTRLLTTEDYGRTNTYMSYEALLYLFVGLALHSCFNSAKLKYKEKFDSFVSSMILLVIAVFGIWVLGGNLLFGLFGTWLQIGRVVFNILLIHCLGSALHQIYNSYMGINYDYRSFVRISYTYAISNIILSVILCCTLFDSDRYLGRVLGIGIPMAGIGIYIIYFFFKKNAPTFNKSYWKYGLRYSIPIIPHGVSQVILSSFDRIMISNIKGDADAGLYSFCAVICHIVNVASNSIQNVWKPWFFEKMKEKKYDDIKECSTLYAFGIGAFTSVVLLLSPEIIRILGTKQYWCTVPCIVPVVLGGYFSFLYSIPSLVEYYYEKTVCIAVSTVGAAALNIFLNSIFIPKYGYIAAAYTTLVTYFLYFIFHCISSGLIHKSPVFSVPGFVGIIVFVMTAGFGVLVFEKMWLVRWGLALVIVLLILYGLQRKFGLMAMVKRFWKRS
ncbi:MAG: oligosaccharide flippase family protein [Lachnospiraceae bacterium]|nr:oligosaccharide flippase family protein [Lachnospiraceae bacterium]